MSLDLDTTGLESIARQMMQLQSRADKLEAELRLALDERDAALLENERLLDALAEVSSLLAEAFGPAPTVIDVDDVWPQVRR